MRDPTRQNTIQSVFKNMNRPEESHARDSMRFNEINLARPRLSGSVLAESDRPMNLLSRLSVLVAGHSQGSSLLGYIGTCLYRPN
jgi:hypothetical protein